jgi:hypothetical protein
VTGGRPTKMTPEILETLRQGFVMGFTDEEACLYANIGKTTLYEYCKDHPEFTELKEQLKKSTILIAKKNVQREIQSGDKDMTKWYLERKAKDEFSTKTEILNSGDASVVVKITKNRSEAEKNAIEPQ